MSWHKSLIAACALGDPVTGTVMRGKNLRAPAPLEPDFAARLP